MNDSALAQTPPLDPFQDGWRRLPASRTDLRNDAAIAGAMLVGTVLSMALYQISGVLDDPAPLWAALIWAVFINVPLAFRRRWPIPVGLVISAAFIVGGVFHVPELLFNNIALFLALYSVGSWVDDRRKAMLVRAGITVAMLIWLLVAMFIEVTRSNGFPGLSRVGAFSPMVAFILLQILTNVLYFGAAYYFGDRAYASARQLAALEWQTHELERERARTAIQAVALERLRIARELHDVVAHHVSVMGVQAAAGRMVLESDPAAARAALAGVEASARTTIDELHRLLTTLRDVEPRTEGASDKTDDTASVAGVTQLPALVVESRTAGVPTTVEIIGEPRPLPAVVSLNLYRIAQEALTNVRKHGGPDTSADVRLRYLDDAVEVEITNDGPEGAYRPASAGRRYGMPGRPAGLGLAGMRERVAASHGTLEVGPRERGGYLVRARMPLAGSQPVTRDAVSHV